LKTASWRSGGSLDRSDGRNDGLIDSLRRCAEILIGKHANPLGGLDGFHHEGIETPPGLVDLGEHAGSAAA
jgi:hypothetical protein